jgi:ribose transport system permease protein
MKQTPSWIRDYVVLALILAGLVILFAGLSERFFTSATLGAIANRIPTLTLAATGMTLVLVIGGIDLSVGAVLALAGAVLGVALVDWHWPFLACAALAVVVGLVAGLANGSLIVGLAVPPFIVTLGMMEMARGAAYLVTGSQTKYLGAAVEGLERPLGGTGLSGSFLLALLVVVLAQLLLSSSVLGRWMFATGSNETTTRFSGIDPRPVKLSAYALAGAAAGLGAVCYTSRLGASDPNAGVGLELSAIAAAVIGGTSLLGGRGSIISTFFGVLIIATLEAGLAQVGASEPVKRLVTGAVIVIAVLADAWRQRTAGKEFPLWTRLLGRTAPVSSKS